MFMQLLVGSLCGNCFTYPDSARCRQWMHDVVHSSELTVLGEADLRALPSALPESSAPPLIQTAIHCFVYSSKRLVVSLNL